jgi:hypothetical protein
MPESEIPNYVIGTVEKTAWRAGMKNPRHGQEIMSHINRFNKTLSRSTGYKTRLVCIWSEATDAGTAGVNGMDKKQAGEIDDDLV